MSMSAGERVIPLPRKSPRIAPARCAIDSVMGRVSQASAKKPLNHSSSFLFGFQLRPKVISSTETTLTEIRSTFAAHAITPRFGLGRTKSLRTFVSASEGIQRHREGIRPSASARQWQLVVLASKQRACFPDAICDCDAPGDRCDVCFIYRDDGGNQSATVVNELRLSLTPSQDFGELLFCFSDVPSVLVHIARLNVSNMLVNS